MNVTVTKCLYYSHRVITPRGSKPVVFFKVGTFCWPLLALGIAGAHISVGLKGQCHEIFWHFLFHELNPSGPLINRLKWFFLKIRFSQDTREKFVSAQANTAQSHTPCRITLHTAQSRTPRSVSLRWVRNFNFRKSKIAQHRAELDSAQANNAQSQTNFFDFRKSQFPRNLGSIRWYFENFRKSKIG